LLYSVTRTENRHDDSGGYTSFSALVNPALTCATEAAAMPTFAKDTVGADLQYTKANRR